MRLNKMNGTTYSAKENEAKNNDNGFDQED